MNRDDVIRMAREAGFDPHDMSDDFTCNLVDIERLAALVAAATKAEEREACAKVCEDAPEPDGSDLADRIRARGQS